MTERHNHTTRDINRFRGASPMTAATCPTCLRSTLDEIRAEAWEMGYTQGLGYMATAALTGNGELPRAANPYRADRLDRAADRIESENHND